MADIKISELTAKGSAVSTNDLFETSAAGTTTKSVSGQNFVDLIVAAVPGETLAQTLALGNTSGANDLLMASGQKVTTNTIDETTAASGVTIDSVLVKDSTVTAGTLTIGGGTITDSSGAISFGNENLTTTGNVDANGVEFDSLSGTGAVAITDILDEDNMASDSATVLATQQSIKAYVDAQVGTVDTLSEVLAIGNTSGATDLVMTSGQKVTTNTIDETTAASGVTIDSVLVKDSTVTAGTLTIGGGTITDSSGAISFGNENLTTTGNVDANGVEFDSLSGTGGVAITDILDEDDMASDSATMLATQQSIKAYVDASGGAPEGTAVLSTGETGGTKFLREDGDGTSSWQIPPSGSMTHISTATISGTSTNQVVITGMDNTYKTYQLYAYWESQSGGPQTEVQLTDGGTRITTAVYNGSRQYNGAGSALLGRTDMYILGAEINQCQLAEIYTFYMNGNNIEMVHRNQAAFLTLAAASPSVWIAQSCHALSSSYSASGNIDGISFTGSGGGALGDGSSFILYGLAE